MDPLTNLAHVDRIVVALAVGRVISMVGILEISRYHCPPLQRRLLLAGVTGRGGEGVDGFHHS